MRTAARRTLLALALAAALPALAAGAASAEVVVYAAGDIADCGARPPEHTPAWRTAELVEADHARQRTQAGVLVLGDNAYPSGRAYDYRSCYHPSWGRFKDITYPAPGNHEYAGGRALGYFSYFGAAAGPGYYSFELGAWHLISLDSNLTGSAHERQLAWLAQDLARNKAHCTLAYWHHPLYSSGGHGNVATMRTAWQMLFDAGAELVLSGHDHDYERFAPQDANGRRDAARGLRQFVVGTGGAWLTPFYPWSQGNSEVRDNSRTGVLKLHLKADGYAWEFLEATFDGFPNGPPPDHGAAPCH